MFAGEIMIRNSGVIIFMFIVLILIYIGFIGLILINDGNDLISISLITVIMFILIGCLCKAVFEFKENNKKN